MTILRKDKGIAITQLGTPGTPGTPGKPATRGHYVTQTRTETTYHTTTEGGERIEIPAVEGDQSGNPQSGTDATASYYGRQSTVISTPGRTTVTTTTTTVTERVWVPGTRAVPAVPATPGTPTVWEYTYQEGWDNAYAVSINPVGEDEGVEFQIPAFDRGAFVGLAARSSYGQSIAAYAVGVMADATGIWVHERGRNVQRLTTEIDTAWTVRIQRHNGRITYQVYEPGGEIVAAYESAAELPAYADIHAFGYMYRSDDEILNAAIIPAGNVVAYSGSLLRGAGDLTAFPLPIDRPPGADSASWMRAMATMDLRPTGARLKARGRLSARSAGDGSNRWGRINGKLPRLAAKLAYTKKFGEIGTNLPNLTGRLGASHIPPRRQTIDLYLMGIAFSGTMTRSKAGRIAGTLPPLAGKLSDNKAFGEIDASLPPVMGYMEDDPMPKMGWLFAGAMAGDSLSGTRERTAFLETCALLGDDYPAWNMGDVRLPPIDIAGQAVYAEPVEGAGDVTIPPLTVGGQASFSFPVGGVGSVTIPPLSVGGLASFSGTVGGAGGVNIPPLTVAGKARYIAGAEGAGGVNLPPLTVKGRAGYLASIKGTGTVNLSPLTVGAKARYAASVAGSGAVNLPSLTVKGRAENAPPIDGAGDVALYPVQVRGAGVYQKLPAGCELMHCGMTGRALIRRFRELSQDEIEPYLWEDCFLLNMLNEAEREAADRAKLLYDDSLAVAVTVKAGTARYAIDPHIIDIERAALTVDGDRRPPLRLKLFDRLELDWRTPTRSQHEAGLPWGRPFGLVFDGKHEVEIVPGPRRDGRLLLGVHRLPWADFDMDAEPEIPCVHHASLVDWALFRAFSIPDADEANEQLATYYHDRFEKYFGRRIDARKRRLQRANKPHINKLW